MSTLVLVGIGAILMYLFDPDSGRRRRALLRDKLTSTVNKMRNTDRATSKDLGNRASGVVAEVESNPSQHKPTDEVMAEVESSLSQDEPTDEVLANRVRLEMGWVVAHPGAIQVTANQGRVTLSGSILADEEKRLLECVRSVRGVTEVENRLETHT
jgi:Predicted periplasmic or secreted lipoprotein